MRKRTETEEAMLELMKVGASVEPLIVQLLLDIRDLLMKKEKVVDESV